MNGDDSHESGRAGSDAHSADEGAVDRALGVALDELIDAIQETKQAVWSAASAEYRQALEDLRQFLISQAVVLSEAEASIGGRSPEIVSPTGHRPRNLGAEAGGDPAVMLELLLADLSAVASDARRRAAAIAGTGEALLFGRLADGIEQHTERIQLETTRSGASTDPE